MTMTRPTSEQVTHRGRLLSQCLSDAINVREFGAKGDGVTDDTAAIAAALAAMPNGGALYFPSGTYRVFRTSGANGDNIVSSNVTIFGDGASTIIDGNPFTPIANSGYSHFTNAFQATGRSNITMRDMSFRGACQPLACWNCTNICVTGIIDDAQLVQNATAPLLTLTNVTVGTTPVATYTGTDPQVGFQKLYVISGVVGMTELNGRTISVENLNTTAKTFEMGRVSTSGMSAYVSGGTGTLATNFVRDKTLYFESCRDVKISGCRFLNCNFCVYLAGNAINKTARTIVSGCSFEHTTPAGQFTAEYPVGVYAYYAEDTVVEGCTFKDIYSSQKFGNPGTGMGYAVYDGDGICGALAVTGNTFTFSPKSDLSGEPIYVTTATQVAISGNTFETANSRCIFVSPLVQNCNVSITGNSFCRISGYSSAVSAIWLATASDSYFLICTVSDNVIVGYGMRFGSYGNDRFVVSGNQIIDSGAAGMVFQSTAGKTLKSVMVVGNRIERCQGIGIHIDNYVVQSFIASNIILDGNLSGTADDLGSAIYMSGFSFGSTIVGNTIGNTPYGGGLFTYGVSNASEETGRIFKDISASNSFIGFADGAQFRRVRFWESSPTNGIYDIVQGEVIENADIDAGEAPGWYCVFKRTPELSSNASSASTTVTVASTTGFLAGDIVLLTKKKNVYDATYYTANDWHVDTIASVTNSTQFVLTTGIPAGDGTYVAGTAGVYVARFKAAAAIAS